MLDTTVTTGRLGDPGEGGLSWTGEPPVLPPVEECTGFADFAGATRRNGYAGQVDLRLDPATSGWLRGQPTGGAGDARLLPVARGAPIPTPTCSRWRWTRCRRWSSASARAAGRRPWS